MPDRLTDKDKQGYLDRALRAADWFVRTQLGQWRRRAHLGDERLVWDDEYFAAPNFEGERDPSKDWSRDRGIAFNADRGRFLYYYYMPDGRYVPGLNWTMGRALFVLTEAHKITGQAGYLQSAQFGGKYIEALCVTDPHYPAALGAIRELTAQGIICGALDGAQAASGLLMLERLDGQANWLRLGRMFCDYVLRHWTADGGLPSVARLHPEEKVTRRDGSCIGLCTVIPLWHLYKRTGEEKYLAPVLWAADRIVDVYQRPDGALWTVPPDRIDPARPPEPNHHHGIGQGEERFLLRNDDCTMLLLLTAMEATGKPKYRDAAVAYARWIVTQTPTERPYCVFPVQANHVLDVARQCGADHSEWVLDHLNDRVLALQVTGSGDERADGGFRGEDEQGEGGVFGGTSLDYVVTRTTCYAAGTLFRLSGRGGGSGFSVAGV